MAARPGTASSKLPKRCDQETLLTLHRALFGSGSERDFPSAWARQGFDFRDKGMLCGLTCHKLSRFGIWLNLTFLARTDFVSLDFAWLAEWRKS